MLIELLRTLTQDIYDKLGSGFYEGFYIGEGKPDLIVGDRDERIVIELKAVESIGHKERAQIENYLRVLSVPLGLLINFPQPTKSKAARDGIEFIEILKE